MSIEAYPHWVQVEGKSGITAWCEAEEQAYIDANSHPVEVGIESPVNAQATSMQSSLGRQERRPAHRTNEYRGKRDDF